MVFQILPKLPPSLWDIDCLVILVEFWNEEVANLQASVNKTVF